MKIGIPSILSYIHTKDLEPKKKNHKALLSLQNAAPRNFVPSALKHYKCTDITHIQEQTLEAYCSCLIPNSNDGMWSVQSSDVCREKSVGA